MHLKLDREALTELNVVKIKLTEGKLKSEGKLKNVTPCRVWLGG